MAAAFSPAAAAASRRSRGGGSGGGPAAAEARSSVAPTGSLPPADDAIPFAPADGAGGRRSGASFRLSSEERFAAAAAAAARYQRDQLAHQRIFADKRARLLSLIEATRGLVRQVQDANAGHCSVRLPVPSAASPAAARDAEGRRGSLRAPESGAEIGGGGGGGGPEEAAASCPDLPLPRRPLSQQGLCRRVSEPPSLWGSSSEPAAGAALQRGGLQVLNLDLKMGNTHLRSSLINPESVSSLFDERLAGALAHLDALTQRVADSSSKILVTGDLNAGKSTFVNALLRREILPVDQQPCTTLFCEVLDATQENGGAEEIHAVPVDSQTKYDRADPRTYVKVDMRHLEKLIDNHHRNYSQLKVYCGDRRSASESLLHNGIVNIALVDSPGLNRDSLKTTALFARQQEIDVVVFVVSAENHFTLSGKEFLWNAGNEKAHIFIVVNRFDLIRKKDKCRHEILDQIRQLSPHTYEDAEDLVHFVSAEEVLRDPVSRAGADVSESFARLEQCLRNFVLDKRARSKLLPAKRYLSNLLGDLCAIAAWNREMRAAELDVVTKELERDAAAVEELEWAKKSVVDSMEKIVEDTSRELELDVRARLEKAAETLEVAAAGAEWTGVLSAWTYAIEVRDRLVEHVMDELRAAEAHVHSATVEAVRAVRAMGAKALLAVSAGSREGETALVPSTSASMLESHPDSADSTSGGRSRERPLALRVELTDFLVDPRDHLSVLNVSVGAVTMVGTKLLGYQNIIGVMWRVGGFAGIPKVRSSRMTWALIGLAGIGTLSYLLSDVQRTVERRLAAKLRRQLAETGYADSQASRAARRSRRQLRLAGWDLQNRFHAALQREERKRSDRLARRDAAREAEEWFAGVESSSRLVGRRVAEIEVDGQGHELA